MRLSLEKIIVPVFVLLFLYFGIGVTYNHQLVQDFPQAFFAMDYGWKTSRADNLLEQGNQVFRAPHLSEGMTDTVEIYPPLWAHQLAFFTKISGLQLFDAAFFLVSLFSLLLVLASYVIVRRFNPSVALLGLPIGFFMLVIPFAISMVFGFHSSLMSHFLLLASGFFSVLYFDKDFFPYFMGVFCAAAFFAHPPEFFYLVGFLVILSVYKVYKSKFSLDQFFDVFKKGAGVFVLFLLLTSYFLPVIFPVKIDPSSVGGSDGSVFDRLFGSIHFSLDNSPPAHERTPMASNFSYFFIPVLLGLVISLFVKKFQFSLLFLYLFLLNFVPYIGVKRLWQFRYFWPVYLIFFFGLCFWFLLHFFKDKNLKFFSSVGMIILFSVLFFSSFYMPIQGTAINREQWDAIYWLRDNSPSGSSVFYLGVYDTNKKSALSFSRRSVYRIEDDFSRLDSLPEVTRFYNSTWLTNTLPLYERTSFFEFTKVDIDDYFRDVFKLRDICSADFILADPYGSDQSALNYIQRVMDSLAQNNASVAFRSGNVFVIKTPGGDCLG